MLILRVQKLNQSELKQVVNLHFRVLSESFLNNFGQNFLLISYQVIVKKPNNVFLLIKNNQQIIGFLVATIDSDKFNQEVIKEKFFPLLKEIIKSSFMKPILVFRLIEWKLKPSSTKKIKPELQFIAVNPRFQNQGLGTKLIKKLNQEFKKNNIKSYRVGTKAEDKLANNFYKKLGFKPFYQDKFFGDDFNYYRFKIFS